MSNETGASQRSSDPRLGTYATRTVAGEEVRAYVPPSLPVDPPMELTGKRLGVLEAANRALGRLDGIDTLLPDTTLFPYMYVRKEALLSSQIEGTQSSLSDLLQGVRTEGAWEAWLDFFLEGVRETGQQAHATARALVRLFDEDRSRVETVGRAANTGLRLHDHLKRHPYTSIRSAADALGLAFPTVQQRMENLQRLGIVTEVTGKARDRIWLYRRYVDLLAEGTQPL